MGRCCPGSRPWRPCGDHVEPCAAIWKLTGSVRLPTANASTVKARTSAGVYLVTAPVQRALCVDNRSFEHLWRALEAIARASYSDNGLRIGHTARRSGHKNDEPGVNLAAMHNIDFCNRSLIPIPTHDLKEGDTTYGD